MKKTTARSRTSEAKESPKSEELKTCSRPIALEDVPSCGEREPRSCSRVIALESLRSEPVVIECDEADSDEIAFLKEEMPSVSNEDAATIACGDMLCPLQYFSKYRTPLLPDVAEMMPVWIQSDRQTAWEEARKDLAFLSVRTASRVDDWLNTIQNGLGQLLRAVFRPGFSEMRTELYRRAAEGASNSELQAIFTALYKRLPTPGGGMVRRLLQYLGDSGLASFQTVSEAFELMRSGRHGATYFEFEQVLASALERLEQHLDRQERKSDFWQKVVAEGKPWWEQIAEQGRDATLTLSELVRTRADILQKIGASAQIVLAKLTEEPIQGHRRLGVAADWLQNGGNTILREYVCEKLKKDRPSAASIEKVLKDRLGITLKQDTLKKYEIWQG